MTDKLFGRKLTGEKQDDDNWKEQHDTAILIAAIDKVLDMSDVQAVRWSQYTPSWSDGEPCRFSVNSPTVSIKGVSDDFYDLDEYDDDYDRTRFFDKYDLWNYAIREDGTTDRDTRINEINGIPTKEIQDALDELETILDSTHHHAWLMTSFGDPAEVTATNDEFHVERAEAE